MSASTRVVGVGWVKGGSIAWLEIERIRINTGLKSKIRLTIYRKIGGQISTRAFWPCWYAPYTGPKCCMFRWIEHYKIEGKEAQGAWSSPRRLSYPAFGQCDRYCINQKIPQLSLENGRSILSLYFKMTWKSRESVDTEQGIGISGEGAGWRVGGKKQKAKEGDERLVIVWQRRWRLTRQWRWQETKRCGSRSSRDKKSLRVTVKQIQTRNSWFACANGYERHCKIEDDVACLNNQPWRSPSRLCCERSNPFLYWCDGILHLVYLMAMSKSYHVVAPQVKNGRGWLLN